MLLFIADRGSSFPDEPLPTATPKSYDESSLDLLAIWFTAVKILHAVGALTALPRLIQLIGATIV
jgi:hypothetical protein